MSKDRGVSTDYAFGKEDVKVVSLQESLEIDYGIIYLKKGRNKLLKEFIECFRFLYKGIIINHNKNRANLH